MADFKRTHWIGWDQVCSPIEEGGLGVRKFEEVVKAFSLKLWWRFREQSSLWAIFLYKKYCSHSSPLASVLPSFSSPTWRRLARTWNMAQPFIRWSIGDGSSLLWDDIWLRDVSLRSLALDDRGNPTDRVADLWDNGDWSISKLQILHHQKGIPQHVIEDIIDIPILHGEKDIPRWTLSAHGKFTLKSAWEIYRKKSPVIPLLPDLWSKCLTTSMSIFAWRLVSNRIPVDAKLQWRKISLASKCSCCNNRLSVESLQHLFVEGRNAATVWREFDTWFPGNQHKLGRHDSIPSRFVIWGRRLKISCKLHLCRFLPVLIFWFIWAERNNARHNFESFRPQNIIWQVSMHIRRLVTAGKIGPSCWDGCVPGVDLGGTAAPSRFAYLPCAVSWVPPDAPWMKLNVASLFDLHSKAAAGGCILRDSGGNLISASAHPFSADNSLEAGLAAVFQGLALVRGLLSPVWIESDCPRVTAILTSGEVGPACSRRISAKIIKLRKTFTSKVTHIPPAGNKIARSLAKRARNQSNGENFDQENVPSSFKAMIQVEQAGLPNRRGADEDPD